MNRVARAVIRVATVWALVLPASAGAQQAVASATITGTVYDPSDAVVVGAAVTLTSQDTNQVFGARTDRSGRYRLIYIPVGAYSLTAHAPGFVAARADLSLTIGQSIELPLKLSVESLTDSVRVVQEVPIVEAARTTLAETITPREVDSLPLNGRNYLDLALLAPNVSRTNTRSNERFAETSAVPGTGISVAGQRNLGNTFIVDGLSANDDAADLAGAYYGEEVIREFQVITSGGGAEFGRASAGVINVVTKSGTNDNRGRAYGFFRNDALDARNPLASRKDPLSQSQYGLTFGGPIVKDRTFWFGNVERTAQNKTGIMTISPANVSAINAALETFRYPGPRVGTGEFNTGYETFNAFGRVDHRVSSASAGASLFAVRRRQPERARRRWLERGEPRDAVGRHRSDHRRELAVDSVADGDQRRPCPMDAQPTECGRERPGRPGGRDLRCRQLRHLHLVANGERPRPLSGGRHPYTAEWLASAEGRRRLSVQPGHDRISRRRAGILHFHLPFQPGARRVSNLPAGVWRAVAVSAQPEPRRLCPG
ncbi:MAG: hypothetical protein GEU82_14690 [Luteitalea sp.]|nr:hypothetical protein [Luteitalea sp.]